METQASSKDPQSGSVCQEYGTCEKEKRKIRLECLVWMKVRKALSDSGVRAKGRANRAVEGFERGRSGLRSCFQTLDQAGMDWKERQKEMQETGRLMRRHLQESRVGS